MAYICCVVHVLTLSFASTLQVNPRDSGVVVVLDLRKVISNLRYFGWCAIWGPDLNCVDYAAGHDGQLPRDRAHSQFELGHVGGTRYHVGQPVGASRLWETNPAWIRLRIGSEDQIIDLDMQTIKPCLTCLFLWILEKVRWTYRRATSHSIQSWSGFILNNTNTVVLWIVCSCTVY